jgi:tellurite resistance protein
MNIFIICIVIWVVWQIFNSIKKTPRPEYSRRTNFETSSRTPSVPPDSVWVPNGEERTVAGHKIVGGLFYFGHGLNSIRQYSVEPSLVDPNLEVDNSTLDKDGARFSYWPSYSNIDPISRNTYLEWLSNGKNDPSIGIGYVFMYFYGLERRALADVQISENAKLEREIILSEVRRLLGIYGESHSFSQYARNLIDFLEISLSKDKLYNHSIVASGLWSYEFPMKLRIGLAQLAADGVPLSPEWALAWVESDPEYRLRTPARRCKDEFKRLFQQAYKEIYGEGLLLIPNKTKLKIQYRPASASFCGGMELTAGELSDVAVQRTPRNQLRKIADECTDQLDTYSRYSGRNNDKQNSLIAWSMLPAKLIVGSKIKEIQTLKKWIDEKMKTSKTVQIKLSEILEQISSSSQKAIEKREFQALSQLLSKLGVGIEPDLRFGSPLVASGPIILFTLPSNAPNAPSLEYSIASTVIRLATAVSAADGTVAKEEQENIEKRMEILFDLSSAEKIRLKAFMQYLLLMPSNFSGIKKQLRVLDIKQREDIGKFLVGIAQAEGMIDPEEIKILSKIYSVLDLDTKDLYSQAHIAATEPVKIESDGASRKHFSIPSKPKSKIQKGVELDVEAIKRKIKETTEVATILSNIFIDEENKEVIRVDSVNVEGILGLDQANSRFVRLLTKKTEWARTELEELAAKEKLLLDGTLDNINDASYKLFNEPFFEGEDKIELNKKVVKEIIK